MPLFSSSCLLSLPFPLLPAVTQCSSPPASLLLPPESEKHATAPSSTSLATMIHPPNPASIIISQSFNDLVELFAVMPDYIMLNGLRNVCWVCQSVIGHSWHKEGQSSVVIRKCVTIAAHLLWEDTLIRNSSRLLIYCMCVCVSEKNGNNHCIHQQFLNSIKYLTCDLLCVCADCWQYGLKIMKYAC